MKAVRSLSPQQGIANIRNQYVRDDPHIQRKIKTSISQWLGEVELAWGRGRQAGIYDAYLTLKGHHPDVADALLKAYDMTEDGAFTFSKLEKKET